MKSRDHQDLIVLVVLIVLLLVYPGGAMNRDDNYSPDGYEWVRAVEGSMLIGAVVNRVGERIQRVIHH